MQATCDKIDELKARYLNLHVDDHSKVWNTEWLLAIELGYQLDVAQAMVYSAIHRRESRGSHQRLDGFEQRDDVNFLKHSLATYAGDAAPRISLSDVRITKSQPGTRAYGAAGEKAEAQRKPEASVHEFCAAVGRESADSFREIGEIWARRMPGNIDPPTYPPLVDPKLQGIGRLVEVGRIRPGRSNSDIQDIGRTIARGADGHLVDPVGREVVR